MRYELSENRHLIDVPKRAGGVDGSGADVILLPAAPIKRRERSVEFTRLGSTLFRTFFRSHLILTSCFSSSTSQILRFSPEVARRSGYFPS